MKLLLGFARHVCMKSTRVCGIICVVNTGWCSKKVHQRMVKVHQTYDGPSHVTTEMCLSLLLYLREMYLRGRQAGRQAERESGGQGDRGREERGGGLRLPHKLPRHGAS